ncbi:phosphatidylglycerophosphate synthase [Diaminobutyricimonas aerilata]|uniref:Phosphatidylglycerophosphate synthase n=1 Tax=Diaminobutyricimonas aerilata TaxID=1162967 RepID=A0A2M9CKM5_9MICO|nr:phosphatidylglycerophosphate synthase [Diaminobutyricimonas aerilata]
MIVPSPRTLNPDTVPTGLRAWRPRYRLGRSRLRDAQKSGAGVPAYLRWVNRGLGRQAAAVAYTLGLTPGAVTAASALVSLAAIVVLVTAPLPGTWAVLASVLLLVGYALDSADGQLARLTGTASRAGEWLDHVVDAVRLPLLHAALAWALIRIDAPAWSVAVALAFAVLASSWFFSQTLAEKLAPPERSASDAPAWVSFVKLPYDTGTLYLLVIALIWLPAFLVLYTALFAGTLVVAAGSLRRKYRMLAEQPAP